MELEEVDSGYVVACEVDGTLEYACPIDDGYSMEDPLLATIFPDIEAAKKFIKEDRDLGDHEPERGVDSNGYPYRIFNADRVVIMTIGEELDREIARSVP